MPEEKHTPINENKDVLVTMDRLIESMEKLTVIQRKIEKQNRIGFTLLRSIAYALGSTVGLAVVISIIFFILKSLGLFDNLTTLFNNVNDVRNIYSP